MPQSRRPPLKLIQSRDSPERLMDRANCLLSEGDAEQATKLYSKILYESSPGHICALLNRSLAYLSLQRPELAVTDTYRAGLLANLMRVDDTLGDVRFTAASRYLRTEKAHVESGTTWTSPRRRFIGDGWVRCPLSNIVINDTPIRERLGDTTYHSFSHTDRHIVCVALEVRALYRLCGALFMCGRGAWSDALGLVDDAGRTAGPGMEPWEWACFKTLGSVILDDMLRPWDTGFSNAQSLNPKIVVKGGHSRFQEQRRVKEEMRAKTTNLSLGGYSCNAYEPDLSKDEWQKRLHKLLESYSSKCSIDFVETGARQPFAQLWAAEDIKAGELVLSEHQIMNVTTASSEDICEDLESRQLYCDVCSAWLLILPEGADGEPDRDRSTPDAQSPSYPKSTSDSRQGSKTEATSGDEDRTNSLPGSHVSSKRKRAQSGPAETSRRGAPPSEKSPPSDPTPEIQIFPSRQSITCSSACRKLHKIYDREWTHSAIENEIRNSHILHSPVCKSDIERKTQCLIDLLLFRILGTAVIDDVHPLQVRDIVFAECGPNNHVQSSKSEEMEQAWSFTDNVVRPLRFLDTYFQRRETDQFAQLEKCDGWVLNTLVSKIRSSMRVSTNAPCTKRFDENGILQSTSSPSAQEPSNPSTTKNNSHDRSNSDPPQHEGQPLFAIISPIINLIRIADPAKFETPNVRLTFYDGLQVHALNGGVSNGNVAIKAGELLLRAADEGDFNVGNHSRGVPSAEEGTRMGRAKESDTEIESRSRHAKDRQITSDARKEEVAEAEVDEGSSWIDIDDGDTLNTSPTVGRTGVDAIGEMHAGNVMIDDRNGDSEGGGVREDIMDVDIEL